MTEQLQLSFDGPIATITNNNPDKHNAFDDEMDLALFEILRELRQRPDVRGSSGVARESRSPRAATWRRSAL